MADLNAIEFVRTGALEEGESLFDIESEPCGNGFAVPGWAQTDGCEQDGDGGKDAGLDLTQRGPFRGSFPQA